MPAWNGGKLLIDMLNEGGILPAPYDQKGFGGMTIEAIPVDEAGGATKQVQEFRNLVQREEVDTVLGYVSSGDCLAIPPVADELKAFTILYDCGTPRVFEEGSYEYVFRTAAHAAMDNISLAKYLKSRGIDVPSFAGINQDYAWGQDSWADFVASMSVIQPEATSGAALFPKIYAGQYGTEISALTREGADAVHSSLWGGDLQAFVLQAGPRGLFERSQVVFAAGDHVIPQLGNKMPDGVIIGARRTDGLNVMAPTFFGYAPEGRALGLSLYIFTSAIVVVAGGLIRVFFDSEHGLIALAIRDNELRVECLGASVRYEIAISYGIAAILGSLGGVIAGLAIGHVDPEYAYWTTSGEFVFVAILSGYFSIATVFVASVLLEVARSFSNLYFPNTWQLSLGIFLIAVILHLPNGLGSILSRLKRVKESS
ncbi:MAG: ABC transporter substrate-binding protein [Geminicoccaceae bacterium]